MDKIYTRNRIKIPRGIKRVIRPKSKKQKLMVQMILILAIAIMTLFTVVNSISPIISKICEDHAKAKATAISNNKATEVMRNYTYDDLVNIYKDSNGNITMLQSNIITINEITSSVAVKIQQELIQDSEITDGIRLR